MTFEERIEQLEMQVEQLTDLTETLFAVLLSLAAKKRRLGLDEMTAIMHDYADHRDKEGDTFGADLAHRIIARLEG
ncbi:hypothetical protein [Paracoccus siganidrum]|uniref:Uncharacterized protein n=1 Tax=Paracoccus siganidrum TaxID=1276757 RepID=A0A419A4D4_9RHOB|nr:hypothetical protein [Paracoccus siganidrum]RJL09143.1 hypothetical protein D3P05_15220 [Paracoccus siganidrum]RMC26533.1 hypothetical protein C9E82_22480 [Paracoccus siganidrum]